MHACAYLQPQSAVCHALMGHQTLHLSLITLAFCAACRLRPPPRSMPRLLAHSTTTSPSELSAAAATNSTDSGQVRCAADPTTACHTAVQHMNAVPTHALYLLPSANSAALLHTYTIFTAASSPSHFLMHAHQQANCCTHHNICTQHNICNASSKLTPAA